MVLLIINFRSSTAAMLLSCVAYISLLLVRGASANLSSTARETLQEAAIHTRELINYRSRGVGVLMSNYPSDYAFDPALRDLPIGLQEYYAPFPDDDPSNGDLLLLAIPISTIFRNAMPPNAANLTMTISDTQGFIDSDGNLAAGRMRIALFGSLERVNEEEVEKCKIAYLSAHPDARGWIPPNGPHASFYARLRVHKVFDFAGFGDVSFIGWIPLDLYKAAGKKMRNKKEVLNHWPIPIQPEPDDESLSSEPRTNSDVLFRENGKESTGEQRKVVKNAPSLIIQL